MSKVLSEILALVDKLDDRDEVSAVVKNCNARSRYLIDRAGSAVAASLQIGTPVSFEGRRNVRIYGKVERFAGKSVIVAPVNDHRRWRVAPGLLRVEKELPQGLPQVPRMPPMRARMETPPELG